MPKKDELEPLVWNHTRVLNRPLNDDDLSTYEKMAFVALSTFADSRGGRIFPSYPTIAKVMSCSEKQARKSVDGLCKKGYLVKKNRRAKDGSLTSNIYTIVDPPKVSQTRGVRYHVPGGTVPRTGELYPLNENQLNETQSPSAPTGSAQTLVAEFIMLHQDKTGQTPVEIPKAAGIFKQILKAHDYETVSAKLKSFYTGKYWFNSQPTISSFRQHYDAIQDISPGGITKEQPAGPVIPWDEMMSNAKAKKGVAS
jgi:hypothetical protein